MKLSLSQASTSARYVAYARESPTFGGTPVDMHARDLSNREFKTFAREIQHGRSEAIDAYFWLPAAAEAYDLSNNIRDYVIVPNVPVILSDVPNTNGIAFSREELLRFNTNVGKMAFATFKGMPAFVEHQNTDPTKASGVILDVFIDRVAQGRGILKVVELLGWDRNKNSTLANSILKGERNCYSMGAYFESFTMSDGSPATEAALKRPLYCNSRNELVYKIPHKIKGFETSSVANPAFVSATGDRALSL